MDMANSLRVLIVDVDWPVASLLAAALGDEGMSSNVVPAGPDAIARKRQFEPHVVVIGLGLSRGGALSIVEAFASEGDCGVMVVSAEDVESAYVASLDRGADDYIVEPMALPKLAARIRAVHRRLSRSEAPPRRQRVRVDVTSRSLSGPGTGVTTLTEAEFALLRALLDAQGGAVSREWLGRLALKRTLHEDDRSVDQLVLKLRRKLAQHGLAERAILSTRGLGYSVPEPAMFDMPRNVPVRSATPTVLISPGAPLPLPELLPSPELMTLHEPSDLAYGGAGGL